jgi:hypothetical protein
VAVKVVVAGYVGFIAAAAAGAAQAVAGGEAEISSIVGLLMMVLGFAAAAAIWASVTAALQAWTLGSAPGGWVLRSATAAAVVGASLCMPMSIANRTWPMLTHRPGPVIQFMCLAAAEGLAVFIVQKTMLFEPSWDDRHRL